MVGIEVRRGVERADFAVRGHGYHGTPHASRPDAVYEALEIEVQRGYDRLPRGGWQGGRGCPFPNQTSPGVDLDIADTLVSPQRVVILPLQPCLSHDGAQHGAR